MELYLASPGTSRRVADPACVHTAPYSASSVLFIMLACNYLHTHLQQSSVFCSSRIFSSQELPFPVLLRLLITWPHLTHLKGGTRYSWPLGKGGSMTQAEPFLKALFESWKRKNSSLFLKLLVLIWTPRALPPGENLRIQGRAKVWDRQNSDDTLSLNPAVPETHISGILS